MILDHPNHFGLLQTVLVGSKLFWLGPNNFGQVKIRLLWTTFHNLDQTKINWTHPKQLIVDKNDLEGPKSFWAHRRKRHKNLQISTFTEILPLDLIAYPSASVNSKIVFVLALI